MSEEYKLFEELGQIPVYTSAAFVSSNVVRVTTTVKDYRALNVKRSLVKYITLTGSGSSPTAFSTPAQETPGVVATVISGSGNKIAVLREHVEQGKDKKRLVEIWKGDALEAVKDVSKDHGDFYADGTFGSLEFSPNEAALVYTAEANAPEFADESHLDDPFSKFRSTPDFGELFPGRKRPTIFYFTWHPSHPLKFKDGKRDDCAVRPLTLSKEMIEGVRGKGKDGYVWFGQAVFDKSGESVYVTGYETLGNDRKLGQIYCTNRPSSIWKIQLPPTPAPDSSPDSSTDADAETKITFAGRIKDSEEGRGARSPRVLKSKDGDDQLVWLSHSDSGPHGSCAALHSLPLSLTSTTPSTKGHTVISAVWDPSDSKSTNTPTDFPGLYLDNLPSRPFLTLGGTDHVILSSTLRSRSTVLAVDLKNKRLREVTGVGVEDGSEELWSWTVFGTDGEKRVLASRSSLVRPNELVVGTLGENGDVEWTVLDRPALSPKVQEKIGELKASIIRIPDRFPTETIVVQRKNTEGGVLPCITVPHGGPHSTYTTAFNQSIVAQAAAGYTISMPNYTGSLGFGEKYVEALMGQCGRLDVDDVMASAKYLIQQGIASPDSKKQVIQGGSHGGFLSGHVIGQFPDFFAAAVMRNPVISVGEMFSTTDIPDWTLAELGEKYDPARVLTPGLYEKLYAASPIAHIEAVKTPVLLLLGDVDRRVPPSQGQNYGHLLKAKGKIVETLMFPGNSHPLDKMEAEKVGWEAGRQWIAKYVS